MKIVGISSVVVLFCLCMFIACTHVSSQIEPLSSDSATAGFIPGLQSPADVLAGMPPRATSALLLERNGNAFETYLSKRVEVENASARFIPAWTDAGQMAVAIYRFNVQGYTVSEIQLDWGEKPDDFDDLWIGLSNWDGNRWDWHPGTPDGVLFLGYDGYADFPKPDSGEMLVAIVMLGTEPALLDRLQVGENQQGDWNMSGHDAQNTGCSPYVGSQTGELKWIFRATGAGFMLGLP